MELELSPMDRKHLYALNQKYQVVRDRVTGVATGRHTGFFCGGRGGIGKSSVIEEELRSRNVPFVLTNSHVTARGLLDCLHEYPEAVHLIEDVEETIRDPQALGVLKSALWGTRRDGKGRIERWITWCASGASVAFLFSGGICMTSNLLLGNLARLAPLKTRISWLDLRVTDEEIAAKMREIALEGYPRQSNQLDPERCMEVVEFVISEARKINRRLDLRLVINSLEDRLQSEDYEAGCAWEDLARSRVRECPSITEPIRPATLRAQRKAAELALARQIVGLPPERQLQIWQEKIAGLGNSRATMYRRLQELAEADARELEI